MPESLAAFAPGDLVRPHGSPPGIVERVVPRDGARYGAVPEAYLVRGRDGGAAWYFANQLARDKDESKEA